MYSKILDPLLRQAQHDNRDDRCDWRNCEFVTWSLFDVGLVICQELSTIRGVCVLASRNSVSGTKHSQTHNLWTGYNLFYLGISTYSSLE